MLTETGAKFVGNTGIDTPASVAGRPITVEFKQFRKRFMFIEAAPDLISILDVAKVATAVLMVVPMHGPNGESYSPSFVLVLVLLVLRLVLGLSSLFLT